MHSLPLISKKSLYIYFVYNYMIRSSKLYPVTNKPTRGQVQEAIKKLRTIKYPVRPISNAIWLKKKLNELNEILRQNLKSNLDQKINAYRQVRGDGNCFFRAFAFSYITNKKVIYHDDLFNYINKISLETCKPQTIPKQFLPFYKDQLLKEILRLVWQKQYNSYLQATQNAQKIVNYKRALANLLLNNPYLDFIIILYFRAVCLAAFQSMKTELKDFLKGTEENQIKTWGQQSQGLVLDCMNRFFQINIYIYELRKNEVVKYQYQKNFQSYIGKNNVYLFYAHSHYDMLEINEDPLAEYQDEKIDEDYYSKSSSRIYVQGQCIQCSKQKPVSSQTSLCKQCEIKSMKSLDTFQKDRLLQGYCTQCGRYSKNISQQLQICSQCLQILQYPSTPTQKYRNLEPSIIIQTNKNQPTKSTIKTSKLGEQNPDDYQFSHISTLNNKLESKISKNAKRGQQEKGQEERSKFRGKQTVMRAKIQFQPEKIKCNKCKKIFQTLMQIEQSEAVCPQCEIARNVNKTSKIKQQMQKSGLKSGIKKEQVCSSCNRPDPYHKINENGLCQSCFNRITRKGTINP